MEEGDTSSWRLKLMYDNDGFMIGNGALMASILGKKIMKNQDRGQIRAM